MLTLEELNAWGIGKLPGLFGIEIVTIGDQRIVARMPIRPDMLAPNNFLHAAAVIALADTACGYGTMTNLPEGAYAFTTIELKSNFLGTATDGTISCEAKLIHGGRTSQVWDATVTNDTTSKSMALFRCTQLILYPRA
jgi:1,4-dihydroxy-2-naphthoyl-CoA hydrolase